MSARVPVQSLLLERPLDPPNGEKHQRGSLIIIGGGRSCPGAVLLAATAALRCAAGRVQLLVDPRVSVAMAVAMPEALVHGWDLETALTDETRQLIGQADAVLVGPGLGAMSGLAHTVYAECGQIPLVLDAGALDWTVAGQPSVVIAPNLKEAAALLSSEHGSGPEVTAHELSHHLLRPVAVRGTSTVLASGDDSWSSEGHPGAGTAGSGDVLMGALGAFLARGHDDLTALAWAVSVHAMACERAAAGHGGTGYLAREIADQMPASLALLGAQASGRGSAGH